MTTDVQAQFSIAEKEEIVAELREKYARARKVAEDAAAEATEAKAREEAAWLAVHEARLEYNRFDDALVEQMAQSL
jgi:predicted kinase